MATPNIMKIVEERTAYYKKYKRPPRRVYISQSFFEILMRDLHFTTTFISSDFIPDDDRKEGAIGKIYGMDIYIVSDFIVATEMWEDRHKMMILSGDEE